jgi:hypothetical protein
MARSEKSQRPLASQGKSVGGLYNELLNVKTKTGTGTIQEKFNNAQTDQAGQIKDTKGQAASQAELRAAQNEVMLASQAFIQTGLPGILTDASMVVQKDILDLMKKIGETLGEGVVVGRQSSRFGPGSVGVMDNLPENASQRLDRNFIRTNPDGSESRTGRAGPNNPPPARDADTLPPWSRNNPLPVIIQPPVPPIVIPEETRPQPRPPRMNDPLFPPPNIRARGTSGEIGSLFEPKDIIAQLHKGERVLNGDENTDLTKLFNMVTGDKSKNPMLDAQTELLAMIRGDKSKNKMPDAQGQMLKAIDSITSGMKTKVDPGANKGFDAAYADMSSGMMNTGPAQQALIDSQGEILKQIDSIKTNAMPTTTNTGALLGTMPSLEIDKEAVAQISQSFKESMGDEFKSAVTNINRLAGQMQSQVDLGLQQQMVGLLEEMRRSMQATAKASERLAQVASN